MTKDIWVVEYSSRQKCYHVDTLNRSVKNNRHYLMTNNGESCDYSIIGYSDDYKTAADMCRIMKSTFRKEDQDV